MREQVRRKNRIPLDAMNVDDVYARNIQVADLNMMNAGLAVVRWKRLRGFYKDLEGEHFSLFTLDGNHLLNEDHPEEADRKRVVSGKSVSVRVDLGGRRSI